jgi:hypothetical protein
MQAPPISALYTKGMRPPLGAHAPPIARIRLGLRRMAVRRGAGAGEEVGAPGPVGEGRRFMSAQGGPVQRSPSALAGVCRRSRK